MKHKKNVLQFLQDNAIMIDSLMSKEERKTFSGSVVAIIEADIKKQMESEVSE